MKPFEPWTTAGRKTPSVETCSPRLPEMGDGTLASVFLALVERWGTTFLVRLAGLEWTGGCVARARVADVFSTRFPPDVEPGGVMTQDMSFVLLATGSARRWAKDKEGRLSQPARFGGPGGTAGLLAGSSIECRERPDWRGTLVHSSMRDGPC